MYLCAMLGIEWACPIDGKFVNANQVRINAALVFLLSATALMAAQPVLLLVLAYDFFVRGFLEQRIGLLNGISKLVVQNFALPFKKENRAPKRFAARIGLVLSLLGSILGLLGFTKAFAAITATLLLFSFLESALAFCAGCIVYTFWQKVKSIK